jgi:NADPH:quinone reductase
VFGAGSGAFAEYISAKESALHYIPKDWSFADSVSIAANAPVTYGGLVIRGGLKNGETVLVNAAAGGLGLVAVQIAKAAGAHVVATASSEEKLDVARRFGADECVNYSNNEDWWQTVLERTGGKGRRGL